MEKIVIVGGGIAGLTCLNALLDSDISPLLIEGGRIGSPKMCGEFVAPDAVTILKNWNIGPIVEIKKANFHSTFKHFTLTFKKSAGGFMRSEAELQLLRRAQTMNARILENTKLLNVKPSTKNNPFLLTLQSGEIIEASQVIFATGKWAPSTPKNNLPYYGIKLHLPHILMPATLQMYNTLGMYFGIIPVSQQDSNITCLLKSSILKSQDFKTYFMKVLPQFKILEDFFKNSEWEKVEWLEGAAPHFNIKKIPPWKNAYWIGDALVSLPPAIGYGFMHSIISAMMAADFYLQNKPEAFSKLIRNQIHLKFYLGKLMHHTMIQPYLSQIVFPLFQKSPWFLNQCLKRLGY